MPACQLCQLAPADLEYRGGESVCYLCAEILEKAKGAGLGRDLLAKPLRLPPEAVVLMGGKGRLRRASVLPLVLVPEPDGSPGHSLIAVFASSPNSALAMACFRGIAAAEIVTVFAHPAIIKMAWRRLGPVVPVRVSMRIAGGYLEPRIVASFSRRQIADYGLLPCRVVGGCLVAATPAVWPPADRGWSESFAASVRESVVRWAGHASSIEIRGVTPAVYERAVREAPWGERLTFDGT